MVLPLLIVSLHLASCSEDEKPALPKPTVDKIEVGSGNNGVAVIGRDFHFNAEVVAGDKIDNVQIRIQQRGDESYSKAWSFEITWDQYKGAKNATVHKHFDIPEDAAEGKYDFIIIVNDENGTQLEEIREVNVYLAENLPVNPGLSIFNIHINNNPFFRNGTFTDGDISNKDDAFSSQVTIGGVKGDGIMYLLLIHKELGHRPETVDEIDFSKVIIYDVYEHKDWDTVDYFSNSVFDLETFTWIRESPRFTIGTATDNNTPSPNPVSGSKAWKSGDYYYGVVYKNTTYNTNFFHYIDFEVNYN